MMPRPSQHLFRVSPSRLASLVQRESGERTRHDERRLWELESPLEQERERKSSDPAESEPEIVCRPITIPAPAIAPAAAATAPLTKPSSRGWRS
jgi:hypothetical protein